jgi:hypothetical protein
LLWSAHPVSLLGKVYLAVSLALFVVGMALTSMTLSQNGAWVEVVVYVLRLDLIEPLTEVRYEVQTKVLLAGWAIATGIALLLGMRAPFWIRSVAVSQRRVRQLEREVLELRTLPLRQHEEDEILAAEAHLDTTPSKVMTEKIRIDRLADGGGPR